MPQPHQKNLKRAVLSEIKERPQIHQKNLKRAALSELKEMPQIHQKNLKKAVLSEIKERAQIRKLRATGTKASVKDLNTSLVKQAYNVKEIQQKLVQLNLMNMKTQKMSIY